MGRRTMFFIMLIFFILVALFSVYLNIKGDCEVFKYSSIKDVPARCNNDFKGVSDES